jgi:DNA-binding protein H-NS
VKTPEQEAALRSIRKLIDFWRIEPEELHFDAPAVAVVAAPVVAKGPKYRHPISGETWDGLGVQPPWLREALTKQGYTVDELRCRAPDDVGASAHDDLAP